MTEVRAFRFFLLALAAIIIGGWGTGAYYLHDSNSALAEVQAEVEAKRQADRDCAAGIKTSCPQATPYDNMPTVLGAGGRQRSFDINSSAEEAKTWCIYSTAAALALVVLFYALRWAMTGRLQPLWPSAVPANEEVS